MQVELNPRSQQKLVQFLIDYSIVPPEDAGYLAERLINGTQELILFVNGGEDGGDVGYTMSLKQALDSNEGFSLASWDIVNK